MSDHLPAEYGAAHVPARVDPPEMTPAAARGFDWFSAAAIGTWVACGLWPIAAIVERRFSGASAALFVLMFAIYGAAMLTILRLPHRTQPVPFWVPLTLALTQTVTGVGMNADTARYLNGTGMGLGLLVIVAAELPYFLSHRWTWTWIGLQTAALTVAISGPGSPLTLEMATFALASIGFQVFAAASSILALSEGRARTSLARTNAELTATRELLAESSRSAERLRISRDLHDTLGHHLTALSLQLDVAARLSDGKAVDHIRQAHAITRLLLSDVRDVVSTLRDTSRMNLAPALRALVLQPAGVHIHLDVPEMVAIDDSSRAEALLRAVQEVLTNAARHAGAANLWIDVHATADAVVLRARDDGRGADAVAWGNGLRGMRERFEEHGGTIDVTTGPGAGFEVYAAMPLTRSA